MIYLQIILLTVFVLIIFNVLKIFILPKVKINKWIVLALGFLTILIPVIIGSILKIDISGKFSGLLISSLSIIFFLWFIDLMGWTSTPFFKKTKESKIESKIVIRPKAKPNRIKRK